MKSRGETFIFLIIRHSLPSFHGVDHERCVKAAMALDCGAMLNQRDGYSQPGT